MAGWYQFRAQHGYSIIGNADTKYTEEKIVNHPTIRFPLLGGVRVGNRYKNPPLNPLQGGETASAKHFG